MKIDRRKVGKYITILTVFRDDFILRKKNSPNKGKKYFEKFYGDVIETFDFVIELLTEIKEGETGKHEIQL